MPVLELMGGSEDNNYTLSPDQNAICVGTQDVLLSRALNRGYARKPFRWPLDFGLLNNDCLWVFDEVQLLGDGLATSGQLTAFREKFRAFGQNEAVWISATLDRRWLDTVNFRAAALDVPETSIQADDLAHSIVYQRLSAAKSLLTAPRLSCSFWRSSLGSRKASAGTLSLIIVQTQHSFRQQATYLKSPLITFERPLPFLPAACAPYRYSSARTLLGFEVDQSERRFDIAAGSSAPPIQKEVPRLQTGTLCRVVPAHRVDENATLALRAREAPRHQQR